MSFGSAGYAECLVGLYRDPGRSERLISEIEARREAARRRRAEAEFFTGPRWDAVLVRRIEAERAAAQQRYAKLEAALLGWVDPFQERVRKRRRRRGWVEDVEWMLGTGEPVSGVCRRVGMSRPAVAQRLVRAGRPDLARPFHSATAERERAA